MTSFAELGLIRPLLDALKAQDYSVPTPIQAAAIPPLLEGRDLLGIAQTGTGKTAAFSLPLLQRLDAAKERPASRRPRALILTPTRELAVQILDSLATYGQGLRLSRTAVYGGVGQSPQVRALSRGVDTLVATPGRLIDLLDQGQLRLDNVEVFILDEADRMLDMGFIHAVRRLAALLPKERQTLLFSATMPRAVADIAASLLRDPVRVEVTPAASTVDRIDQRVLFVTKADKRALLGELMQDQSIERALVFTRTKHGADRVAEHLARDGVRTGAIHGNKTQGARQQALNGFRNGRLRVLVATDIAARGIDVDGITHVINFDLPNEPESYVHRIGRTARAGAEGIAISFCDAEETAYLRDIEKVIKQGVPVDADHPYHAAEVASARARRPQKPAQRAPQRQRRPHRGQSGGSAPRGNSPRPRAAYA